LVPGIFFYDFHPLKAKNDSLSRKVRPATAEHYEYSGVASNQMEEQLLNDQINLNPEASSNTLGQTLDLLSQSLVCIDPKGKRHSLIWTELSTDSEQQKIYKNQLGSVRTLIKLQLLTQLSIHLFTPKSSIEFKDKDILECFKLLQNQPSLAESMMSEIFRD
jgi:hypothetical protein